MDQRELERQDRDRWRILDRLSSAVEDLADAEGARAKQTAAIKSLLKVLGSEEDENGIIAAIASLPKEVADAVTKELNSEALDLVRHVRHWRALLNGDLPKGMDPRELPPIPMGASGWELVVQPTAPHDEPHTGVFDLSHTDGRKKKVLEEFLGGALVWVVKKAWSSGLVLGAVKWAFGGTVIAAALHFLAKVHPNP